MILSWLAAAFAFGILIGFGLAPAITDSLWVAHCPHLSRLHPRRHILSSSLTLRPHSLVGQIGSPMFS
jgi:hypothetical protein